MSLQFILLLYKEPLLLAIVGPVGAGKVLLLHVLNMYIYYSCALSIVYSTTTVASRVKANGWHS